MHKTWSLVAQTSVAKVLWVLATLVTTAMTARYLGPTGRGVYVAAVSWVTTFSTLGYLSLSQVIVYLATGKKHEDWLPAIVGSLITILGTVAVLSWVIVVSLYLVSGGAAFKNLSGMHLLVAFAALPFLLWIENGNGILMAMGRLHVLNLAQVAGGVTAVLLTFLLLGPLHLSVSGGLVAFVIAQSVVVAISLGYVMRQAGTPRVEREATKVLLTGGAKVHLNAIGTYLFTQANIIIINNYVAPSQTAFYQLALQLVAGMQIIPLAVSTVAYSIVSRDGPDRAWPEHRKLLAQVLLLVLVLSIIAAFVAPFAVRLVFGAAFAPSVPLFRVLLLSTIGSTMAIVMAAQWIGRGLFLQSAVLTFVLGLLVAAANLYCVPRWGMSGAVWVTVAASGFSVLGNTIMALWIESRLRAV
jgi:O-antigen/teichoic acid export membrane protein